MNARTAHHLCPRTRRSTQRLTTATAALTQARHAPVSTLQANTSQDCSSESVPEVAWPGLRGMRIFGWTVPVESGWIKIGTFEDIPIPAQQVRYP